MKCKECGIEMRRETITKWICINPNCPNARRETSHELRK